MSLAPRSLPFLFAIVIATAATPPPTLRDTANHSNVLVGAAIRPILLPEPAYSATLAREFNLVEPEDAMKWWTVRQKEDAFDFRDGDAVVRFAEAHAMKVRGHCLVWDHNNPDWLSQGNFTSMQLARLLQLNCESAG